MIKKGPSGYRSQAWFIILSVSKGQHNLSVEVQMMVKRSLLQEINESYERLREHEAANKE